MRDMRKGYRPLSNRRTPKAPLRKGGCRRRRLGDRFAARIPSRPCFPTQSQADPASPSCLSPWERWLRAAKTERADRCPITLSAACGGSSPGGRAKGIPPPRKHTKKPATVHRHRPVFFCLQRCGTFGKNTALCQTAAPQKAPLRKGGWLGYHVKCNTRSKIKKTLRTLGCKM